MFRDTAHKGAHNELVAAAYLLRQGYQVFRNISPTGPVDLIAIKDEEIIRFDVKQVHNHDEPKVWLTEEQLKLDIKLIKVYEDGRVEIDLNPVRILPDVKCECCSQIFTPSNKGTQRKFCSAACKKAVYSDRRSVRDKRRYELRKGLQCL